MNPHSFPLPALKFDGATPLAKQGLGGLIRDHFGNGRINCTVGHHGGLINIAYWGDQHLGASNFFRGALETGWQKTFRMYVGVGDKNYYPTLHDTRLYPFGLTSHPVNAGVKMDYELLLLPDALIQRVKFGGNARRQPLSIGMIHQEEISAIGQANRTWEPFVFDEKLNVLVTSCLDINPPPIIKPDSEESLAQRGLGTPHHDAAEATTWIGLGCDIPFTVRASYHPRNKTYFRSETFRKKEAAFYLVFARSREQLEKRLATLRGSVHRECEELLHGYEKRLGKRPQIDVGDPVLDSAFLQFPEMVEHMKVADSPGVATGTLAGYWVWGWDGMMPLMPTPLANETEYPRASFHFFQRTLHPKWGIPVQFSTAFEFKLKESFPAQCQYIASLYHYIAVTGDVAFAREVFPTCMFLLERCRLDIVKDTGLVSGIALWPDFPEAMGEDGHDISSLNNSLLYQGLRAIEYIALALGETKTARDCREWARKLRASFVKYLYDAEEGYFISSCSSIDFTPRKHYCCQAIFWLTSFARELVSHNPAGIARFMDKNLRAPKCLLSLPHWDTAWMADGNQLGSSYPVADFFYLGVHKLAGNDTALKHWLADVKWFWQHHTAPEAWTPEAENEEIFGPDNWGGKQCQAVSNWYANLYFALAGLDFDHEGLTITPLGDRPVKIAGLRLHGVPVDFTIRGKGPYLASLKLNGRAISTSLHKIPWKKLAGKRAKLEIVRTSRAHVHPVILRADGLHIDLLEEAAGRLIARVTGQISGEVVVRAPKQAQILIDGQPVSSSYDAALGIFTVPFTEPGERKLEIVLRPASPNRRRSAE
jgi:hypothetical protein